jgi:hypothetical protein
MINQVNKDLSRQEATISRAFEVYDEASSSQPLDVAGFKYLKGWNEATAQHRRYRIGVVRNLLVTCENYIKKRNGSDSSGST